MFIDTHAHLFSPDYNGDVNDVIQASRDAGIDYIIVPATDIASTARAIELAEKYDFIYATAGIHPHDTKEWNDRIIYDIEEMASHPKVVAIGEIGLDYYYDFSPKDKQLSAFRSQLELAIKTELPAVIHNREADDDVMNIIRSLSGSGLKAQFHCFAGSLEDARELVAMHHFISFTGNITYPKSESLRNIVKNIQVENLLLETDSPYMSPNPFRGKRNSPANVKLVAEKIAELQNITLENVAQATSFNAFRLFGIGTMPGISHTYRIGDSLYINVTNRCNADCIFCDRKGDAVIKGYSLKMTKAQEPPAEVYIKEIGDPKAYREIVFCGYGEPTIRWDVVRQIARYVKNNGGKTRLNTNGHGNFINKRDITPELKDIIDSVSISLNAVDSGEYARLMKVPAELHTEMLSFAKKAKNFTNVVMTIVGLNGIDEEKAKSFVTEELGTDFRTRPYF